MGAEVVSLFSSPAPGLANQEAEQFLLGMLLAEPKLIAHLPPTFDPSHYAYRWHAEIHQTLVALGKPGVPAAVVVCETIARDDRELRSYVSHLLTCFPTLLPAGVLEYSSIITELHRRRTLLDIAEAMRAGAAGENRSTDAVLARALSSLDLMGASEALGRPIVSLDDAMEEALRLADRASSSRGCAGVSTGMPAVDEALGGLEPGTLTVIAGRPGMGKSALAMGWALGAARAGHPVLFQSLEMSAAQLGRRVLSAESGVTIAAMKRGQHQGEVHRLLAAKRVLRGLPIRIDDGTGLTAAAIELKARALHRRSRIGLMLIDHLNIVRIDDADARAGATQAITNMTGAFKRIAKSLEIPVILLTQLNRGVEGRDDKRPTLADLRQSGSIEQDADAVAFVYRAEYYLGREPEKAAGTSAAQHEARLADWHQMRDANAGKADLILAKIRDGEPCTVPLRFDGARAEFSDPSAQSAPLPQPDLYSEDAS